MCHYDVLNANIYQMYSKATVLHAVVHGVAELDMTE